MFVLVLLVLAFLLALIAAVLMPDPPAPRLRVHLGWLSLAAYFLAEALSRYGALR